MSYTIITSLIFIQCLQALAFSISVPNHGNANVLTSTRLRSSVGEMVSQESQLLKRGDIPVKESGEAIICGGGPIGLATALMLAKEHHFNVSIYEASTLDETYSYDPSKAFMYLINERGSSFTKDYPFLQQKLKERGVRQTDGSTFVIVPSDVTKPIESRSFSLQSKKIDRTQKEALAIENIEDDEDSSCWIPRHEVVEILHLTIADYMKDIEQNGKDDCTNAGTIKYHPGKRVVEVKPSKKDLVTVVVEDVETGERSSNEGSLVVATDGWRSKVRECLENNRKNLFSGWNGWKKPFKIRQWKSPSTGLRLKALQMPPQFTVPDGNGVFETKSANPVVINGKNKGPRNFLKLSCLCMKNNEVVRPANCITRPDHEIWKLKTGEEMRNWFDDAFPTMPFQKEADGGIIPDKEWDRFAKSEGTTFPHCQYSSKLQISSPSGRCGVVLLGDSAHAFPPDIGQGINAGLQDVVQFDQDLKHVMAQRKDVSLGAALQEYERKRVPETKALIQLARVGAPYQYNQPHYIDRLNKKLYTINVISRMLLNKLTFGVLSKPCVMAAMNKNVLPYRQVMRRANLTTIAMTMALLCLFYKLFKIQRLIRFFFGAVV